MRKIRVMTTTFLLGISLLLGSDIVRAEENGNPIGDTDYTEENGSSSVDMEDADELLWGYIDSQLYNSDISLYASGCLGDDLTGNNKNIYDYLKSKVEKIADGTITDTVVVIPVSVLSMDKKYWSASDLGVSSVIENDAISNDAVNAFLNKLDYDLSTVIKTVIRDCPYAMYWFGGSYTYTGLDVTARYFDNEYKLCALGGFSVSFSVSGDYAGDEEYTVDSARTKSVSIAVANAKKIVAEASEMTDLEKLDYYLETICEYTEYNDEAAGGTYTGGYGDPWQLIYVFDGDASTKVVCEGYSKAFKYLCDLTSFDSSDIYAYCVSGTMMSSNGGGGGHMWNIIHMDDGNCYLVDATNCDQNTLDKWLFIAKPYSGDAEAGYVFRKNSSYSLTYTYNSDTQKLFPSDVLELSDVEYTVPENIKSDWLYKNGKWYYYNEDGRTVKGWKLIDGHYYYFNPGGDMVKSWKLISGKYYFFDSNGYMSTGWKLIDGKYYYFNPDGDMVKGWKLIGGRYYYFNPDGDMVKGWKYISGKYYYFNPDGDMVKGWKYISGKYYYFNPDGDMVKGWKYISGKYYYFNPAGDMVKGWRYISGKYYFFDNNGYMSTGWKYIGGRYYYFNADGDMAVNKWIDGVYYVRADGTMAVSQWINGKYYVDGSGRWVKTR